MQIKTTKLRQLVSLNPPGKTIVKTCMITAREYRYIVSSEPGQGLSLWIQLHRWKRSRGAYNCTYSSAMPVIYQHVLMYERADVWTCRSIKHWHHQHLMVDSSNIGTFKHRDWEESLQGVSEEWSKKKSKNKHLHKVLFLHLQEGTYKHRRYKIDCIILSLPSQEFRGFRGS